MGCYADNAYPDSPMLELLWKTYNEFCSFVNTQLYKNELYFAGPCILINIFHFIVLTRSSLRTSTVYIIMAAIALVDIASSLYVIQLEAVEIFKSFSVCYSSSTYYKLLSVDVFLEGVRTVTRRCSTWLSFSITLIRTLAIRYAMNPKFEILSKQKTAFFLITLVFVVFIPIQVFGPYRLEAPIGNYTCKPNVTRSTYTFFWYTRTEFYMPRQEFLAKTHKVVEGLLSRILPCVLVPIATVFLIREIKKTEIQRKKMASSSNMKSSKNTSKLVLALTLTFFVAELPLGIVYVLKPSNYTVNAKNIGFTDIIVLQTFEEFFSVLLTITTATHMIICVFMSSQYRETALSVVRCGYVPKPRWEDNLVVVASKT